MEGFEPPRRFSTPASRFSRPVPSAAWVHLQMYSRSNVPRKKERNLERNPDFLLISRSRTPLKTQEKLENGFQNTLPFSRPPRYDRFGNSPWTPQRLCAQKITTNHPRCQSKSVVVQGFSAERGCIKGILWYDNETYVHCNTTVLMKCCKESI